MKGDKGVRSVRIIHTNERQQGSPEVLPTLCPAFTLPLAHRGRLELVRHGKEDDVLGIDAEVLAELDGAIDRDVVPFRFLVLVKECAELAGGRSLDRGGAVVVRIEGEV